MTTKIAARYTRQGWRNLILHSTALYPQTNPEHARILEAALDLLEADPTVGTWHAVWTAGGSVRPCPCTPCVRAREDRVGLLP